MARANLTTDRLTRLVEQQSQKIGQILNRAQPQPARENGIIILEIKSSNLYKCKRSIRSQKLAKNDGKNVYVCACAKREKVMRAAFTLRESVGQWWNSIVEIAQTSNMT